MTQQVDEALYLAAIARVCRGSNVIGVAFFVAEGYLLTCAHVVAKALGYSRKSYQIPGANIIGQDITLEFRQGNVEKSAEAKVVYWRFPDYDPQSNNDLAVLKLQEPMPAGAEYFSLSPSSKYRNQDFQVLGFPSKLDPGGWATGTITGRVYDTSGLVQMQDNQTPGYAIEPGFSGSPVWSSTLDNTIVGMTVARDKEREEAKVGFMLPVRRLKRALEAVDLETLMDILELQVNALGKAISTIYPIAVGDRIATFPMSTQTDPIQALRGNLANLLSIPNQNPASPGTLTFAVAMLTLPDLGLAEPVRIALTSWLQHRVVDVAPLLATAQQALTDAAATASTQAHLLLWVRNSPEYESQNRYLVEAYCIPEIEAYDPISEVGCQRLNAINTFRDAAKGDTIARGDLEKVLQACLQEVSTHYRQEIANKELILELLLPIPLLNYAVDQWDEQAPKQIPAYLQQLLDAQQQVEASDAVAIPPIGSQYQVMLRIAERVDPILASRRSLWETKWLALKQAEKDKKLSKLIFIAGHCKDFQAVFAKGECLGMHLNTILPDASLQLRLFALAMGATPAALWMRQPTSKTSYKKTLKRFAGASRG